MPRVIDFPGSGDHRSVAICVLDACRSGGVVGLPSEAGYLIAVSAIQEAAVGRLLSIAAQSGGEPVLLLAHPEQVGDLVEAVPGTMRRLVNRAWPGPVFVEFDQPIPWSGPPLAAPLLSRWTEKSPRLGMLAHPLQQAMSRCQQEPLLALAVPAPGGKSWTQADGLELAQTWGDAIDLIVNAGFTSRAQLASVATFHVDGRLMATQAGAYSADQLARLMARLTLFVCTGNTCRSPLAEGLFRRLLCERLECTEAELSSRGHLVASAGVAAQLGAAASEHTLAVLAEEGVDLNDHSSQPVTDQLVGWADLILAMTDRHRQALIQNFPEHADKVQPLCPDGADVADPYGGDHLVYAECRDQIRDCLDHWIERVLSD